MGRNRGQSRFERLLFSVMGPPQLGDAGPPASPRPDRPVELCPRCGQPRDDHEVVRTARLTYTRCAADQPPGDQPSEAQPSGDQPP